MKQLKAMIFDYIDKNGITNEELKKLLFAIAKETTKTKHINRVVVLYLQNRTDFKDTLEDILQQAVLNFYTDKETAFKITMRYVYNQHTKRINNHYDVDTMETIDNGLYVEIDTEQVQERFARYNIQLDSKEKQEYYTHLIIRTEKNSKKRGGAFKDKRQREQTINKLKKLQIIEA